MNTFCQWKLFKTYHNVYAIKKSSSHDLSVPTVQCLLLFILSAHVTFFPNFTLFSISYQRLYCYLVLTMANAIRRSIPKFNRALVLPAFRLFHDEFSSKIPLEDIRKQTKGKEQHVPSARSIAAKYQVFRDTDAPVILDVDEERQIHEAGLQQPEKIHDLPDMYSGINLSSKSPASTREDGWMVTDNLTLCCIIICSSLQEAKQECTR